jgi:hypothetical protein
MRAKNSGQSALLLLDVIDLLSEKKIPYAIIGALAASFYGTVRASVDADAIISLATSPLSAGDLAHLLSQSGMPAGYRRGDGDDPLQGVISVKDKYGNRVDLITGIKGMDDNAFNRTAVTSFLKHKICLIGVEDFIAMKLFAGSTKDIADARAAIDISRPRINTSLLREIVQKYGKRTSHLLDSLLK